MSEEFKVLLVDDDEVDSALTQRMLRQGLDHEFELDWAECWESGHQAILNQSYSLYLIDYRLGARDGLELVRELADRGCTAPIILLTGMDSSETAIEAVKCGASDYLVKDDISPALLAKSVRYSLARQQFRQSLIEAREQLKQKNQKLSQLYNTAHQFVDNVSHEFRTPLAVIKEYSSILQEGIAGPVNSQQVEFLKIVLNRVEDLVVMVNDMLDSSRLDAGLLKTRRTAARIENIIDHVEPVIRRRADAASTDLVISIEPGLPEIFCDVEKIDRVLVNLVVNAIKFSGEGGRVELWVKRDKGSKGITVGVTDNGPGISQENQNIIFERFRQSGDESTAIAQGFGLGLSISSELVKLNFGQIHLRSEPGKGSTFSFGIPANSPAVLMHLWIGQLEKSQLNPGHIHHWKFTCDTEVEDVVLDQCDEILVSAVYNEDLLVRTSSSSWLLLASTSQDDVDVVAERVQATIDEVNAQTPHQPLPKMICTLKGVWLRNQSGQLSTRDKAALKTSFLADCEVEEAGLADTPFVEAVS